jgi:hypothetical protein
MNFITFDEYLLESSLSRIYHHTKNSHIGIISAHTPANPGESVEDHNTRNANNTAALKDDLKKHGLGHTPIRGRYVHKDEAGNVNVSHEHSFLVTPSTNKDGGAKGLETTLTKLGSKYKQHSVLHKAATEDDAHLIITTHHDEENPHGSRINVGKWHPNRTPEFHSMFKGKGFAFGQEKKPNLIQNKPNKKTGYVRKLDEELMLDACHFEYYHPISFFKRKETLA